RIDPTPALQDHRHAGDDDDQEGGEKKLHGPHSGSAHEAERPARSLPRGNRRSTKTPCVASTTRGRPNTLASERSIERIAEAGSEISSRPGTATSPPGPIAFTAIVASVSYGLYTTSAPSTADGTPI